MIKIINAKGRRILIIPDLHSPFHHPNALLFLHECKKKYLKKDSIIVNLGDEIDNHNISFHDSDPDVSMSPSRELEKASEFLQDLERIFSKMYLLDSNHGSLIFRRLKHHQIPVTVLKPLNEIYGVSVYWTWHEDIVLNTKIGDIYLCHGRTASVGKLAREMGMSAIQGHFHGKFCINWFKSALVDRFDAYSGCLIDRDSLAFAYGKNHLPKAILGCMVISESGYPRLIKMELNNKGRWTGNLP